MRRCCLSHRPVSDVLAFGIYALSGCEGIIGRNLASSATLEIFVLKASYDRKAIMFIDGRNRLLSPLQFPMVFGTIREVGIDKVLVWYAGGFGHVLKVIQSVRSDTNCDLFFQASRKRIFTSFHSIKVVMCSHFDLLLK